MKAVAAVAIVVGIVAMPAWAQHGASHGGGFSGHAGSMGHASAPTGHFSAPMSHSAPMGHFAPPMARPAPLGPVGRFAPVGPRGNPPGGFPRGAYPGPGPMRFGGPAPVSQRRPPYTGSAHLGSRGPNWNSGNRRGRDRDGDHHRRHYFRGYGLAFSYGYPYFWPGYPFLLSSCILGCDSWDYDGYGNPYGYGTNYGAPAPYGQYGDAMTQYPGYPAAPAYNYGEEYSQAPADDSQMGRAQYSGPVAVSTPPPQQPLTVVFKDGQHLQVHNYLLTATALTVLDDNYRQIPLDQIDMAATRQTNLANGLDFRAPRATQATPGQLHPGSGSGQTPPPRNQMSALPPRA